MEKPVHVQLNEEAIRGFAAEMKVLGPTETQGVPVLPSRPLTEGEVVSYELMSCAVNYCFWYGFPYVRPNGASAFRMNELLDVAFDAWITGVQPEVLGRAHQSDQGKLLWHFVSLLAENQFPIMVDRTRHLLELEPVLEGFSKLVLEGAHQPKGVPTLDKLFRVLVQSCPGFAEDPFFKRASLFFMQLNRRMGWFDEEVRRLPIPADYQIPRVLRDRGAIQYSSSLAEKVDRFDLIPSGSGEECEIRAASIVACDLLAEHSGWTTSEVDYHIWCIRNTSKDQFHMTVTPNY